MSRTKHAMQKPMFAGLPWTVRMTAAAPISRPQSITSQFFLKKLCFSMLLLLNNSIFRSQTQTGVYL